MKLSVIIPCKNRARQIGSIVRSLCTQTLAANDYEVIVADDCSSDDTPDRVKRLQTQYPHIQLHYVRIERDSIDFKAGTIRNRGVATSKGSTILFLDSDVLASPNLLLEHVQSHEATPSQKVVIGYVFRVMESDQVKCDRLLAQNDLDAIPEHITLYPDIREETYAFYHIDKKKTGLMSLPAPWRFLYTNNVSISRELFLNLGGFDETFSGWGDEDIELGYRVFRAGHPLIVNRNAFGFHYEHPVEPKLRTQSILINKAYYIKKYNELDAELYNDEGLPMKHIKENSACLNRYLDRGVKPQLWAENHASNYYNFQDRLLVLGKVSELLAGKLPLTTVGIQTECALRIDEEYKLAGVFIPFDENTFDVSLIFEYINELNDYLFFRILSEALRVSRKVVLFQRKLSVLQRTILNSFDWVVDTEFRKIIGGMIIVLKKRDDVCLPRMNLLFSKPYREVTEDECSIIEWFAAQCRLGISLDIPNFYTCKTTSPELFLHFGSLTHFIRRQESCPDYEAMQIHINPNILSPKVGRNAILITNPLVKKERYDSDSKIMFFESIIDGTAIGDSFRSYTQIASTLKQFPFPEFSEDIDPNSPFINSIQVQVNKQKGAKSLLKLMREWYLKELSTHVLSFCRSQYSSESAAIYPVLLGFCFRNPHSTRVLFDRIEHPPDWLNGLVTWIVEKKLQSIKWLEPFMHSFIDAGVKAEIIYVLALEAYAQEDRALFSQLCKVALQFNPYHRGAKEGEDFGLE